MNQQALNNKGFTLVEVLVALVVLAVALSALIFSSQQATRGATHLVNKTIAHWVAMNIASEIHLGLTTPPLRVYQAPVWAKPPGYAH